MVEPTQILLIALIAFGHVKLYFDGGNPVPLSPVKYNRIPYGFASFWNGGKFVSYIDLRQ